MMVSTLIMTAALILASIVIKGFTAEGGGMLNGGPPFYSLRGRVHSRAKWGSHHFTLL